ncbi:hypothetical protein H4R34_002715 [Dimargaris verticillata]|uniref:Enoyl reductase (ER) domain-containing protein n=1 Tax=Dimargaris verticillata TaxID=2761393 RepID=A0A9W8B604_9FUNG|nr:hypothetical protein H4R34_002715 [Dimargaris verticillata]
MSSVASNTVVVLSHHVPYGRITASDFEVKSTGTPSEANLKDHEIIVTPHYVSVDPYMRGRIVGASDSYVPPFGEGKAIDGYGVAKVVASKSAKFAANDVVVGAGIPFVKYSVLNVGPGSHLEHLLQKAQGPLADVPVEWHVGNIGMPSFTAWYGLKEIGKPKKGETIVVSAASGAVGQVVVQLSKLLGLRVVAAAGSDEKVQYLKDTLKADVAFNYKKASSYADALSQACPKGIDIYFDNVGGEFLDAVLEKANTFARIIACGAISQYQVEKGQAYGIQNYSRVIARQLTIQGFIISDYYLSHYAQFVKEISNYVKKGQFTYKLDVTQGLENAPQALVGVLEGKNFGKAVVKVD